MCGRPAQSKLSIELRRNGCSRDGLGDGRILDERHRHVVRTGLHRHAHAQARVDGVARVGRLVEERRRDPRVPPIVARYTRRPSIANFDLVRIFEAAHDVQVRPIQLRLEDVVAVERERVADRGPADRAERQAFDVLILREVLADAERVAARGDVGIADGQRRDLRRRRQVALLQRRRDAEHVGDVVEAVRRIVRRQERRDVDVEREQVANRVGVLAAVQPMQDRRARDSDARRPRRRAALQARDCRRRYVASSGRRAPCGGIDRACSLRDDVLPDVRGQRRPARRRVSRATGRRLQPIVVADDAVAGYRVASGRGVGAGTDGHRRLSGSPGFETLRRRTPPRRKRHDPHMPFRSTVLEQESVTRTQGQV